MAQKIDSTKLIADLKSGLEAAKAVAASTDDGGTCNFDSPMFWFDRSPSAKVRATFEAALTAAALGFFWTGNMFGKGKNRRLVFGPGCGGQANSRTRAAETFHAHLKAQGWTDVGMYYQMD